MVNIYQNEDPNSVHNRLLKLRNRAKDILCSHYLREKIKNKNFTIISNNCVGGWIYRKLALPYTTPTIGMFFFSDDYINFLEKFEYYIKSPLDFIKCSKHQEVNVALKKQSYPVGLLGEKIEIQFIHFKDEKEVLEKWNRRVKRINFDNLFIIYSDRDNFKEEFLDRFDKLQFHHKIFFSSKPRNSSCVVFIKDFEKDPYVGQFYNREYEKYIDIIKWLNGEENFLRY